MAAKKTKKVNKKETKKVVKAETQGLRIEEENDVGPYIKVIISSPNLVDVTGANAKQWLFDVKKGFSNNLGIELVSSPEFNKKTNRHETTWHLTRGFAMFELNR